MNLTDIAKLIFPLALIPFTLYAVLSFGHDAGNAIIGFAFFIGMIKFAGDKERKFMIILAFFASLFEGLNVALGAYKYINAPTVPIWVGLGWGVLGIYLVKNLAIMKKINGGLAYLLALLLYLALWGAAGLNVGLLIPVVFSIAAIYVLSLSSKFPASFFLYTSFIGIVIEFSGTSLGVWTYFDGFGGAIPVPLISLGMAYAAVLAFTLWLSKID